MKLPLHPMARYCILVPAFFFFATLSHAQVVDMAKSFANISKLNGGGTFMPNDTIEIRVTLAIRNVSPRQINNVRLFDTVPIKTAYIPGSMRITTNEGITFRGPFSDAADTDPGTRIGSAIRINLGAGANGSLGGTIRNTDKPSFFGSTCIMVAAYRVKVNSSTALMDTIKTGGKVMYDISGVTYTRFFPATRFIVSQLNLIPCLNGTDISAASDSLGTFGSGIQQNRPTALGFTTTYIKQNINASSPNDYYYALVKNSSANGSTNPHVPVPNSSARVFGFWDIAGDHTGAADPAQGNPPSTNGTRGGYMVLINSSYKTDTAYREVLSNLCPNTYYEFSAWFRNVCPRCSSDSNGRGSSTTGFIPGPGNDSSGVKPNVSFEIDGLVYYTTGDIDYDRQIPWKKFGFTFRTKPNQTTAEFLIRNNSPGGGGNDWALDDIKISHCGPSMVMNYNPHVLGCSANPFPVNLSDTIRYIYTNSYIYYKWQVSNVGGTVWTDLTGPGSSGIGSPSIVNGQYQYVTNLPPFLAYPADSGKYFRVITATSIANLNSDCAYHDGNKTMIKVINCGTLLNQGLLQLEARLQGQASLIRWSMQDEQQVQYYLVERSRDGMYFDQIQRQGLQIGHGGIYYFRDENLPEGICYYRIRVHYADGRTLLSVIRQVRVSGHFTVDILQNPVSNLLDAGIYLPEQGPVHFRIIQTDGRCVSSFTNSLAEGNHRIQKNISNLLPGMYILECTWREQSIRKKIMIQ